jgi:hypothetical protein
MGPVAPLYCFKSEADAVAPKALALFCGATGTKYGIEEFKEINEIGRPDRVVEF